MASPQAENGHTDIANEIMEAFGKIRISGEARQVLDVILRKTYGWHKPGDHISLSQFRESTMLKTPHISRALDKLQIMNIIVITNKGDTNKGNFITFNKDFDTWKPLPKKVTLPKKIISITKKDNGVSPKKVDTKETITKENKEIKTISPVSEVLSYFGECFKEKTGQTYHCVFAKDTPIMKSLLTSTPLPELKELIKQFFQSTDSFIVSTGYTIGVLGSQINKLKIEISKKPKEKQYGFR